LSRKQRDNAREADCPMRDPAHQQIDSGDHLAGGAFWHERDQGDLATIGADGLGFGQTFPGRTRRNRVVTALNVDCRLQGLDQGDRGVGAEEDDAIDRVERGQQFGAFVFRHDRAARPFQAPGATIVVHPHDQEIAEGARRAQVAQMPDVQEIEMPVREDDTQAA
jgi:hypothetical protein